MAGILSKRLRQKTTSETNSFYKRRLNLLAALHAAATVDSCKIPPQLLRWVSEVLKWESFPRSDKVYFVFI